ncbi:hypothetical protein GH714_040705 [Hevea brasiliensis]|uniref:PWWP domain-containing protein n=1 Tax=Hevea brasiliensis TaxID=3981 RepID=A0A6A6MQN8_HEVBR|nr:hypothetical protein GH714_040705 [Hevea brasiliensis]
MENHKTQETLEVKLPHGKTLEAQNPDIRNLVEASGPSDLFGLSKNCIVLESNLEVPIEDNGKGNVELVKRVDDIKAENLDASGSGSTIVAADVNNIDIEKSYLVNNGVDRAIENGNSSTVAGLNENLVDLSGAVCEDVEVEKTLKDEDMKEDELLGFNGVVSGRKLEVCGGNLSLYVDFSDSLSRVISYGLKPKISWWPGKIYDPLDAREYAVENEQRNCLLVGYLGISYIAWCLPSQLKPFHENFEQMAGQNKARSFLGAVEKAVDEFGKCLKSEMTCPCILKKFWQSSSNVEARGVSLLGSRFGEFSSSVFEPAKFLAQIKNLAQAVSKLGMLELTVAENFLSAFYHSLGHSLLPMEQLWESTDDLDNAGDKLMTKSQIDAPIGGQNSGPAKGKSQSTEVEVLQQNKIEDQAMIFHGDLDTTTEICEGILVEGNGAPDDLASNSKKRKRKRYSELKVQGQEVSLSASSSKGEEMRILGSPTTVERSSELRVRKKSKYLSYPFVNWEHCGLPNETEDPKAHEASQEAEYENAVAGQFIGSHSISKSSGKRIQNEWFRKFTSGNDALSNPELISAANLLSELCFTAVDCLYPNKSKNFDLIVWFFSRFRISVYHDESIYEMNCKNVTGSRNEALLGKETQETSQTLQDVKTELKMQKKKKNGNSARSKIKSLDGLADVNINNTTDGLSVEDFCEVGPPTPNGKPGSRRKRSKEQFVQISTPTKQLAYQT